MGDPKAAALSFDVAGNKLTGGVARHPNPKAVVLLCHGTPSGYPDEPGDRGYPGLAEQIAGRGFEVWWFNFRGARDSEGAFTFSGWCDDLNQVTRLIDKGRLPMFVVGASAGGAIALSVAANTDLIDGVVTLAAPATWEKDEDREDMLEEARRVGTVPREFPSDESQWWAEFFENPAVEAVKSLGDRPVFIVHGSEDRAVPTEDARKLHEGAQNSRLLIIEGAGHQLRRNEQAVEEVINWLEDAAVRSRR